MGISPTGHAEIDQQHLILESIVEERARFCAEACIAPDAPCDQCHVSMQKRSRSTLASITGDLRGLLVGLATYEERKMELLPRTASCRQHQGPQGCP